MIKKSVFIVGAFLLVTTLYARDSTKVFEGLNFRFDNRYCYSKNNLYWIPAFKLGVTIFDKYRMGLGFNYLYNRITKKIVITDNNIQYQFQRPLQLYYFSCFYEWIIYKKKRWEFYIPLQFGYGTSYYAYTLNSKRILFEQKPVVNLESVIGGHYKIFWWSGVGAGTGYQYMINAEKNSNELVNGFIFYLKIKVFVGDMYNHFVRHKNINTLFK